MKSGPPDSRRGPSLELGTPPPAVDPLAYADLVRKAQDAAGTEGATSIVDVRIIKVGWDVQATVRTRTFVEGAGDMPGVTAEVYQGWAGVVNLLGRVEWLRTR